MNEEGRSTEEQRGRKRVFVLLITVFDVCYFGNTFTKCILYIIYCVFNFNLLVGFIQ